MTPVLAFLVCLAPVPLDGDTFRCAGPTKQAVRVFAARSDDFTPADTAAKARLAVTTAGGLVCEPRGASYNRIVARCWNGAGLDVGEDLIRGGYVTEWCSYSANFYGTCAPGSFTPERGK